MWALLCVYVPSLSHLSGEVTRPVVSARSQRRRTFPQALPDVANDEGGRSFGYRGRQLGAVLVPTELLRRMSRLLARNGPTETSALCPLSGQRWGNRPAFLWIAERFGVLRFRLMVKRGPCMRPQASEGEAQHGLFCWTRRVGPGDERLHCG